MGGSSILYSSRGWGNSFPSRGGEQTCPPCPPPSLVVFFVVLEGGGILFSLGVANFSSSPPSLYVTGDEIVRGGGPWG